MGWSVWDRLSSITAPTLLLSAEHDYSPVAEKIRMAAQMPHADLTVIEEARHALPVERPDAFNAAVETFLEDVSRDP
jgi:pimeloyl-ACP methyl ester carboxylesterase